MPVFSFRIAISRQELISVNTFITKETPIVSFQSVLRLFYEDRKTCVDYILRNILFKEDCKVLLT